MIVTEFYLDMSNDIYLINIYLGLDVCPDYPGELSPGPTNWVVIQP